MKYCNACKESKPKSEFARRGEGLQPWCNSCKAEHGRKHYQKNKELYKKRRKQQRIDYRALLDSLKSGPCVDCKNSYPPHVMDLDHVRGKKLFSLSYGIHHRGVNQILAEAEKCDLVCANCHRERTHRRGY